MLTGLVPGLVAAIGLVLFAGVQSPPPPASGQPSNRQTITLRGCIKGSTIQLVDNTNNGSTYALKGSKAMLDTIKEHQNHEDEISGTTQIADSGKTKAVKEKQKGRTRVYVGAGHENPSAGIEGDVEASIDVTALTHLRAGCS